MTTIADTPLDDFKETLTRVSAKRRHIYSAATLPTIEHEGIPRHQSTRGGMTIMPSSLANLAEQLRQDLDGTAAAFRGLRSAIGGVETPSGSAEKEGQTSMTSLTDGKIVSSTEFSRILLEQVGGNLDATTALTLRFELQGRATVGGVEYHRDGGPSDEHNRFAKQAMDIALSRRRLPNAIPRGGSPSTLSGGRGVASRTAFPNTDMEAFPSSSRAKKKARGSQNALTRGQRAIRTS